ncbi:unnamed protein product [Ixodes persulcatus]
MLLSNDLMFAAIEASSRIPRSIQAFRRNERWFEDTLPHLPEHFFKQSFRVKPVTFRYLVRWTCVGPTWSAKLPTCVPPFRWRRELVLRFTSCARAQKTAPSPTCSAWDGPPSTRTTGSSVG